MNTLFIILAVLALVGSVLITLIVLLQNSKGGGLASNFTAGNQTFGVRQTTDILEKITWGLAIFILVVSIIASFTYKSDKAGLAAEASDDTQEQNAGQSGNSEGSDSEGTGEQGTTGGEYDFDGEETEVTNPTEE